MSYHYRVSRSEGPERALTRERRGGRFGWVEVGQKLGNMEEAT